MTQALAVAKDAWLDLEEQALMLTIGITGPIGCGKSTVARWLGERAGVRVIDADHEARLVLAPGHPRWRPCTSASAVRCAVERRAGPGRPRTDRVQDEAALRDLEGIVRQGPATDPGRDRAGRRDRCSSRGHRAIKLVEGGLGELCDEVWLVTCDPMVQRERLVGRGEAAEDAEIRVQMQGDLVDRLRPRAARVVDERGPAAAAAGRRAVR